MSCALCYSGHLRVPLSVTHAQGVGRVCVRVYDCACVFVVFLEVVVVMGRGLGVGGSRSGGE